jgi:hypothetical protein
MRSPWIVFAVAASIVGVTILSRGDQGSAWSSDDNQVAVFGGTSWDYLDSVAADSSGNVVATGSFEGTADFEPGSGTTNLTSGGYTDIYVTKLDSSGELAWARQMGGVSQASGHSVALDSSGNVYVAGRFRGTADFDPGEGTQNLTSNGDEDGFVVKLDSNGEFVWAKSFGGAQTDVARGVAVDSAGNVYVNGYFRSTADFDPGTDTQNKTAAGSDDIYLLKLNADGDFVSVAQFGSTGYDQPSSIAVDSSDNVLLFGNTRGTIDLDPGAGNANFSPSNGDFFIVKLDSNGTYTWSAGFTGASYGYASETGEGLATDSSGNVYATGYYNGTVDFDPGAGIANMTATGNPDVFVLKLNSSGALLWAKSLGGSNAAYGRSIDVDSSGNVYTTGNFDGTADFDPGSGTENLSSAGGSGDNDVFVSKLNSSGEFVWAKSFIGTDAGCDPMDGMCQRNYEVGYSIAIDGSNNVYAAGYFVETVDFDPGSGTEYLTSAGSGDAFIVKMNSAGSTSATTTTTPAASGPRVPGQVPPWPEAIPNVDGTVTVSWAEPFQDGAGPITGYRAVARPQSTPVAQASDGPVSMASGGSCSTTGLVCVIAGLDENVDYLFEVFASNSEGESAGRMTQQTIRIVPQTPATTIPDTAPETLPAVADPQPLPVTGSDDDLVMWSMLLIAFGALSVLYVRRTRLS